jgi:ATP-dependent RNA helicase DeaD
MRKDNSRETPKKKKTGAQGPKKSAAKLAGKAPPKKGSSKPPVPEWVARKAKVSEKPSVDETRPKRDSAPVKSPKKEKRVAPEPPVEVAEEEPLEIPTFAELGLSENLVQAIGELGFERPTPIQARAIPVLLGGRDLIGQAQTGTGKTAAFALPLLERTDASRNVTQALVLVPTRELAVQVAGGIWDLAKHTGLKVVPVYGGQPIDRQFRSLRNGAHIVVGTPGRVLDHLRRGSLTLGEVWHCTLDEADEMLALGLYGGDSFRAA